jgi:malonyl-CoA decarboxylase
MTIGRFAKNIFDSIADAGEKFLDLRLRGSPTRVLIKLCEDLVSHKGVASGVALAREVVHRYQSLKQDEKLKFLLEINQKFSPNFEEIKKAADDFVLTPDEGALRNLSSTMESNRKKLFSRMNMAPDGTPAIVSLRQDLLGFIKDHSQLRELDEDLKELLTSWFNPGFLTLRRIDWDTEASILEKIIQYEAVHSIANWNDLKQRLVADRRCFAYFHPALEDEPLIFVEVALTKGIASSIQTIFKENGQSKEDANTAIFYSINNCQQGLRQIPLGNFLIKRVVNELALELPSIKTYSTLSPVTGFTQWLQNELKSDESEFLSQKEKEILNMIEHYSWPEDKEKRDMLQKPLIRACANYLVNIKKNGKPINAVARFHFGNGASLYRINWMGDTSRNGIKEYFGLLVNYLYDPKSIESNHERYVQEGKLAVSKSIRSALSWKI